MTVSTVETRKTYNGNGTTDEFATPYFLVDADLAVYVDGTLQTITTHYTVAGAGVAGGGTVTFVTPPSTGTGNVVIIRDPALTQLLDLVENDSNPAETREQAFDKLTMIAQRLADRTDRVVRLSDTDTATDIVLPELADRASKYLAFDSEGLIVVSEGTYSGVPLESAIRSVKTHAELRATTIVNGSRIYRKAHTTEGDGGALVFRGVTGAASGTYTENGGTVAVPVGGDGSSAWVAEYGGAVNVRWFGAVSDGVTDSSSEVQAAVNASNYLHFPGGQWVFGDIAVNTPIKIVGETVSSEVDHDYMDYTTKLIVAPASTSIFDISADTVKDREGRLYGVSFSGISFDGQERTISATALVTSMLDNLLVENCSFVAIKNGVLKASDSLREGTFRNVWTRYCGDADSGNPQFRILIDGDSDRSSNNIYFENVFSIYALGDHFSFDKINTTTNLETIKAINFDNCMFHGIVPAKDGSPYTFTTAQKSSKIIDCGGVDRLKVNNSTVTACGFESPAFHIRSSTTGGDVSFAQFEMVDINPHYAGGTSTSGREGIKVDSGSLVIVGNIKGGGQQEGLVSNAGTAYISGGLYETSGAEISGAGVFKQDLNVGSSNAIDITASVLKVNCGVAVQAGSPVTTNRLKAVAGTDLLLRSSNNVTAAKIRDADGIFQVTSSAWDGEHLMIGSYHFWVDSTGVFRIKATAPTSDTDGTVVGAQT
jgi:hypothetical protein